MKNLNILFYILTLPTFFTLTGCGSSDDYWQMEDPKIVVVDSNNQKKIFNNPSEFKNKYIKVSYGSHLNFNKINEDVTFSIQSTCKVDDKVLSSEFKNQKIYQKLYFYNYIPIDTLTAKKSSIQTEDFSCYFKVSASNKVNSEIVYNIPNLLFNTVSSNKITIGADYSNSITNWSSNVEDQYIDFTDDTTKNLSAAIVEGNKIFYDTKIICRDIEIQKSEDLFGTKEFSIQDFLTNSSSKDQLFYRNCRIISLTKSFPNNDEIDHEVLWSGYFNAILSKPRLQAIGEIIDSSNTYYSDNHKSFSFNFANIQFMNLNHIPTFIRLKKPTVNANLGILHPYISYRPVYNYNGSRIPAHNILNKRNIPSGILKGNIETKINFITGLEGDELIDLSLGKTHIVSLQAEKNFSCSIDKKRENGLWLQAITPYSQEDQIEVYVFVNNQIEKFPMPFYLSEILNESNSLNLIPNSKYVFDALLLPKLRANSFKNADNHDEVYRSQIRDVLKYSYSKNISEYKNRLAKKYNVSQTCRIFED